MDDAAWSDLKPHTKYKEGHNPVNDLFVMWTDVAN